MERCLGKKAIVKCTLGGTEQIPGNSVAENAVGFQL